jgi:hypothetical protein
LSLEIWKSSGSKWLFIFTIEKRSEKPQETVHFSSEFRRLSHTCPGSEPWRVAKPWANIEYTIGSMVVASPESGPWCVM